VAQHPAKPCHRTLDYFFLQTSRQHAAHSSQYRQARRQHVKPASMVPRLACGSRPPSAPPSAPSASARCWCGRPRPGGRGSEHQLGPQPHGTPAMSMCMCGVEAGWMVGKRLCTGGPQRQGPVPGSVSGLHGVVNSGGRQRQQRQQAKNLLQAAPALTPPLRAGNLPACRVPCDRSDKLPCSFQSPASHLPAPEPQTPWTETGRPACSLHGWT